MKIIKKSSEYEMIAVFLQAETNSLRFGNNLLKTLEKFKAPKSIIEKPNLDDKEENKLRKKLSLTIEVTGKAPNYLKIFLKMFNGNGYLYHKMI